MHDNEEKTLKFDGSLVPLIFAGEKRTTWRVNDDKDLQEYDRLILINKTTGKAFAKAVIKHIEETTLGDVDISGRDGHEAYESRDAMYQTFRSYYGNEIGPDTPVKIITFSLV